MMPIYPSNNKSGISLPIPNNNSNETLGDESPMEQDESNNNNNNNDDEPRRTLQGSGVLNVLSEMLIGFYENPNKPKTLIEQMLDQLANEDAPNGCTQTKQECLMLVAELNRLKLHAEELNIENERLRNGIIGNLVEAADNDNLANQLGNIHLDNNPATGDKEKME